MARFDVFRHPDAALRKATPFLVDVQNDYISGLGTRVVLPMRLAKSFPARLRDLNPEFRIANVAVVLDTAAIGAFPAKELKTPVTSLAPQSAMVVDALDSLFGGY